nr:hypothetical protein [Candidatus Sigynarchaeum springense]
MAIAQHRDSGGIREYTYKCHVCGKNFVLMMIKTDQLPSPKRCEACSGITCSACINVAGYCANCWPSLSSEQ